MSEDRIWRVAQSVGFDDYELRPMLEAFAALAQQAQEPVVNDRDCPHCNYTGNMHCGDVAKTHGGILNPEDCSHAKLFGSRPATPPAPQPALVDERSEFEAAMREKHGWVARDFQSDSFGYFDGRTATAWLAWQARAALQSPAPQAGGWLPIESAPKDGTRLILWWGGKPVFAGWLDNSQCKHPWAGWQTPSLTPRPQGEPTHYMPPPPAPQTKVQP